MKNLSILFCFFLSFSIIAQDENPLEYQYIQDMGTALDDLSEAQQLEVLCHALQTSGVDVKKELSSLLKTLNKEEQKQVLRFAQNQSYGDAAIAIERPTSPAVAPAYAPPAYVPEPAFKGPVTSITFDETEFDFGTIDSGEKVIHVYKFTNSGTEPLIISNAKGSCGCTVPLWPKEPIAPGASAEIEVAFDSKGKKGKQNKRVTITANTEPTQSFLTIKGDVTPKE